MVLSFARGNSGWILGKKIFTEMAVKYWSRLPREAGESPSLEVFRNHIDVELDDMVLWWTWQCYAKGWTRWS